MITITIDSIDKTADVEKESLVINQTLSKEPSTLSFSIKGEKNQPELGDAVLIEKDSTTIWQGTIVERHAKTIGNVMTEYEYLCMDGYFQLDRKLVSKAYNDTNANAVVTDIINTFVTGITLDLPASSPTIKTARFNYEQPSRCIQKIANQIGWDWYIDQDYVLHFFSPSGESAPFEVQDDNGTVISDSLRFDSNIVELKNVIYVRGGEYLDPISSTDAVDKYEADGEQVAFPLVYRYNAVQVTVDGIAQTVGVDFIDDPADFDCLYNFQEKLVRFPDATKPAAGEVVKVFGNAYIPLIVQGLDTASIEAYGEREGVEIDKTITSIEEGELLATAILEKWKDGSLEGKFRTRQTGLVVGQTITINSTRFGVNQEYKINRIKGKTDGNDEFVYDVEFITSGQITLTDMLIDLIGQEKENIQISPDEVIQRFRVLTDSFSFSDEMLASSVDSPPYHYGPVTSGNEGRYNFSTYS